MKKKGFSKYHAKKVVYDGITFDSQKEKDRYCELKLMEKAGVISNLQLQVPFVLIPAQYIETIEYTPKTHREKKVKKLVESKLSYIADFVYNQNGEIVVEDVKGYKKGQAYAQFVAKRKAMLYFYGIQVKEV